MNLYDIVTKLTGPIEPVGESNEDEKRLNNLKELTYLVDKLIYDIDQVAMYNKDRVEASMQRIGKFADDFLTGLGIED